MLITVVETIGESIIIQQEWHNCDITASYLNVF